MLVSVIIPTYNPNIERLQKTIDAIDRQTYTDWEGIIVDNNSNQSFENKISISNNFRIVKESNQGLTYARLKGFKEAKGEVIVMVDDDNVLNQDFLNNVVEKFGKYPRIGAIGGNIEPEFEIEAPAWTKEFSGKLAIRDLGNKELISEFNSGEINHYPDFAPVGAGMAIRKEALQKYIFEIEYQKEGITDRKGNSLASSGDNEIVMYVLKSGFEVAFFPGLKLKHLIPESRLTKQYLARLNHGIMKSWTQFMIKYQICPWNQIPSWTVVLRKLKSFIMYKAWQNKASYIHWKCACGMYEGLSK